MSSLVFSKRLFVLVCFVLFTAATTSIGEAIPAEPKPAVFINDMGVPWTEPTEGDQRLAQELDGSIDKQLGAGLETASRPPSLWVRLSSAIMSALFWVDTGTR